MIKVVNHREECDRKPEAVHVDEGENIVCWCGAYSVTPPIIESKADALFYGAYYEPDVTASTHPERLFKRGFIKK